MPMVRRSPFSSAAFNTILSRCRLIQRLATAFCCAVSLAAAAGTTNSWRVFQSLSSGAALGPNRVQNPGMEITAATPPLASWGAYGTGYAASTTAAHSGIRSLQCSASSAGEVHGGSQTIYLNQIAAKAIKLSGWSKALGVTGNRDSDYSVYLDIIYNNGTPLWGQTVQFSPGTHDWEYQEAFIIPALPIRSLTCYVLFRNSHTGTVWFDDITVAEVSDSAIVFDGEPVTTSEPVPLPFDSSSTYTLQAGNLEMKLSQDGGTIQSLSADGVQLHAGTGYASGWFLCDRAASSDWWNVGGTVTSGAGEWQQRGVVTPLNLAALIRYSVTNNAIRIQATVSNLISSDRAVSLYFALPVLINNGQWWNSPRDHVSVTQAVETATLSSVELGARNLVSQYPLATISGNAALNLAVPPDQYRPFRLAYNRATRQFYAAFDLGISAVPTNFPQTATAELWLYPGDPAWGMRSGLAGYYRQFPGAFSRNFTNEGIWVAFADIRSITNISDFGIAYHEISYNPAFVKFDDTNNIQSYRYVSEPWSYWMPMPTSLSNTDYPTVYNYLLSLSSQGNKSATATLSSGVREPNGSLKFFPAAAPWCPYGAAFYNNASPFIWNPQYSTTKFSNEWNSATRDTYNHPENGALDGEYIDSFMASAAIADYSTNHLRSTSFPLTYTRGNFQLMTPLIYGTWEMSRAIGQDLRGIGKPIIANTLYTPWPGIPIGIGLFDFTGTEMNFFDGAGNFVPPTDASLLYPRALSGARPYGFLLNTDFTKVSSAEMESYMRVCAVYGIYPSAFSADAASNNYFEQPGLYERDRILFKKYIPIVKALSAAGWSPVTDATVNNPNLALESFGTNAVTGLRYLTVRNLSTQTALGNISFDVAKWSHPAAQSLRVTNLFDGSSSTISLTSNTFLPVTLTNSECRVYSIQSSPPPKPTILLNDGNFGVRSNYFGFTISAFPGQTVVVESAMDLVTWTPVQTNVSPENGFLNYAEPITGTTDHRFFRARVTAP